MTIFRFSSNNTIYKQEQYEQEHEQYQEYDQHGDPIHRDDQEHGMKWQFFWVRLWYRIPTVNWKFQEKHFWNPNREFCHIKVIVFDLDYLLVVAIGT